MSVRHSEPANGQILISLICQIAVFAECAEKHTRAGARSLGRSVLLVRPLVVKFLFELDLTKNHNTVRGETNSLRKKKTPFPVDEAKPFALKVFKLSMRFSCLHRFSL